MAKYSPQPQPDALGRLDERVQGQPDGQVGERACVEREPVLDQPDQLGVVKVEAEILAERADARAGRG